MFRSFSPKKRLLFRDLVCLRIRPARIPRESGRNLHAPDRTDLRLSPDLFKQVGRQANTVFDLVLEENPHRYIVVHRVTSMDLFLLSLPAEVLVLVLVIHIRFRRILNMLPLILLHLLRPILAHMLLPAMRLLIMECQLHHLCNHLRYTYLLNL
jgi:hypothetical protein